MSDSYDWLTQVGQQANFAEVTFIREGLALTNLKPPNDPELLKQHGIRSILSLFQPGHGDIDLSDASTDWASASTLKPLENLLGSGDSPHPKLQAVGVTQRIIHPLTDDGENKANDLIRAVQLLEEMHAQSAPVLVHCRMGASRTPAVTACYLAKKEGRTFKEVIDEIAQKRSVAISTELAITITQANGVEIQ